MVKNLGGEEEENVDALLQLSRQAESLWDEISDVPGLSENEIALINEVRDISVSKLYTNMTNPELRTFLSSIQKCIYLGRIIEHMPGEEFKKYQNIVRYLTQKISFRDGGYI